MGTFISLTSVLVGAVVGGLVVHRLALRRESLAVRRSQRDAFLLDAYRKLIDASERDPLGEQRRDNLESALADIMLLGGAAEIEALRASLRNELGIEAIDLPGEFNFRLRLDTDEKQQLGCCGTRSQ